jgi:hypothetical protein
MSLKEDIEQAIHAHGAWKAKFRDFLSGKAAFDLAAIGDTQACQLGHWLAQEGRWLLPESDHAEISKLHTEFHQVMGAIVQKIKHKDFGGARHDLGREGVFDQASLVLTVALRKATMHSSSKPMRPEGITAPLEAALASPSRSS